MDRDLTLPGLQLALDSLPAGRQITLSRGQVDRLFGLDDVGTNRLLRFAGGDLCEVVHETTCFLIGVWVLRSGSVR